MPGKHSAQFTAELTRYRDLVESALDEALTLTPNPTDAELRINEMLRYAVIGGGKRLRGILTLAFRERISKERVTDAIPLAAAIELLHAYTLIHDDLPCMDNDDFRRGKPSVHKAFGEWQALLAGDALQALAFGIAARSGKPRYVEILAQAAFDVCVGQYMDLRTYADRELLFRRKTGALFAAACMLGCDTPSAENYGYKFGLTFQLRDDIMDGDGSAVPIEIIRPDIGDDFLLELYHSIEP
ncbi:MAG: polyprenyl synthetase family protein [Oscillospiraceae bacterium]|jgi:geranylgeranyl pyrophosphate synthase|nr:polyprenyl synthetase family protein [Oscillospiraceae bacterium]